MPAQRRPLRLALALAALSCCGPSINPPEGLLATPAGLALSGTTLLLSNQDNDELRAWRSRALAFVPSPIAVFPLSIPTVRRPGPMCADARQAYVASTIDPTLGVVDAMDDPASYRPASGLRELGEVALPGIATALVCAPSPEAVTTRQVTVSGSPAAYRAALAGDVLTAESGDGRVADGGPDEQHAIAALPAAAITALSRPDAPTAFYEIENDITGAACPDAGFVERCAPGADASVCPGPSAFCPSVAPLLTLPPQPARCDPSGPPLSVGFDIAGSGPGTENLGLPTIEPVSANLMMAGDRHSSCVARVDLSEGSVTWVPASTATTAVAALPYLPGSCQPGGTVFAAALDSENCERRGPPPLGGYFNCNGVVFFQPTNGIWDQDPAHERLPAPLPYPFQMSPDRLLPPVEVGGIVTALAFTGANLQVSQFSTVLSTPVPIQMALIAGTANGDLFFIDLGVGWKGGGTGQVDGGFPCPPAYLAPRLLDENDYLPNPTLPAIQNVAATDGTGTAIEGFGQNSDQPVTASGAALSSSDRLGAPLPSGATCWGASGFDVCLTAGMVQHGVARNESFTVTYQGPVGGPLGALTAAPGTVSGATLTPAAGGDLTAYLGGLLPAQQANLIVSMASCGDYLLSAVEPDSLSLAAIPGGAPLSCAQGAVTFSVLAGGAKPYTVVGSASGFTGLWPADGSLHLVKTGRWQYPADLIAMGKGAEQLVDLVFGPQPTSAAPGSTLSVPRPEDYDALDSSFGLAVRGRPGGAAANAGTPDGGTTVITRGASVTFSVTNGVQALSVNPEDGSALIDSMASYEDPGGLHHVFASYRGNNALVDMNPNAATVTSLVEEH